MMLRGSSDPAAALLLLMHVSGLATAFLNLNAVPKVASTRSSTTLFYRDDVPPIGSTPKWETPNDFQQFLTQCSMQSFMFLCHSLRDDQTVRWLHEFTEPVLQSNFNTTTLNTATAAAAPAQATQKKKVSLEEAANSALADMETELMAGFEEGNTKEVPPKPSEVLEEPARNNEEEKKINPSAEAKVSRTEKSNASVSIAQQKLIKALKTNTPIQSGFTAFSKQANKVTWSFQNKLSETEDDNESSSSESAPKTSWAPTKMDNKAVTTEGSSSNTDVSALYGSNSIPGKQPKDSSSSSSPKKQGTVNANTDISALYGSGSVPQKPGETSASTVPKQSFSPFGKKGTVSSNPADKFATTSSMSYLYAAPEPKQANEDEERDSKEATGRQYKNLPGLKYHGLAIFNCTKFPTWDSYFKRLLEQPKQSYLVESNHKHVPSYEFDVDPATLCTRMLSVRAQIAEEFEHDLTAIAQMGGHTLKSYWKMLQDQRAEREEEKRQQKELEEQRNQSWEQLISKNGGARSTEGDKVKATPYVHRANLLFLDSSVSEESDYASPSPLRKGNFDLLTLLTTQEAIHRVLNDPQRQARKSAEHGSNQFLQDFYVTRLLSHFSGDQPYGRADDFLEELLSSTPRMITVGNNADKEVDHDGIGNGDLNSEDGLTKDLTYLIDPIGIAETILDEREKVALEWKQQLQDQTKADHMAIQKMVLAKLMGDDLEACETGDSDVSSGDSDESCFE